MSELLDTSEAAHYLGGVSVRTVQREVAAGRLAAVKVRGSTRFRLSELDRYLRSRELRATA